MAKDNLNNHLVSVIITNWNGKHLLEPCLGSIFSQTYKDYEVIIVDGASSDGSVMFVKENYPQVKLIELKDNKGPPYAINLAASQARGDYILILNNDVALPPDLIKEMVAEIEKDDNSVINPVELDWNGNYVSSGLGLSAFGLSRILRVNGKGPFLASTACCMISRKVFLENQLNVNFFIYEDIEWGWRLHMKKIRIKVLPNSFFLHKYAGTVGKGSPKYAFFAGRTFMASRFICLKYISLVILAPVLLISYIKNSLRWYKRGGFKVLKFYFFGNIDFFKKLNLFIKDRNKVQEERLIGDCEVLKILIGGEKFERTAREHWFSNRLPSLTNIKEWI